MTGIGEWRLFISANLEPIGKLDPIGNRKPHAKGKALAAGKPRVASLEGFPPQKQIPIKSK